MNLAKLKSTLLFTLITISALGHSHSDFTECSIGRDNFNELEYSNSQIVYVCLGDYAYAYHSIDDCPGLINCKGDIRYTDENTALNKLNRVPCCRCWSNVIGRCKDDNPYYSPYSSSGGGGDGGEAYAAAALAIVAASAFILSNDMYIHGVQSFHQYSVPDPQYWSPNYADKQGYSFGFRKTWPKYALEYGASMINREYSDFGEGEIWGGHINLVREILPYSGPVWADYYIGPSIVYREGFSPGGVCGVKMKITNRLFFDVRYSVSGVTNHVGAGLIFNYQKEYFWNR